MPERPAQNLDVAPQKVTAVPKAPTAKLRLENTLKRADDRKEALCKNPKEEALFAKAAESSRLSPDSQRMIVASLSNDLDQKMIGGFKNSALNSIAKSAMDKAGKDPLTLDTDITLSGGGMQMDFSKADRFIKYEKTPEGTTKVNIIIPLKNDSLALRASRGEDGQITGGMQINNAKTEMFAGVGFDGAARLTIGKGGTNAFSLDLGQELAIDGKASAAASYSNANSGTQIFASVAGAEGEAPSKGETPSAQFTASQRLAEGHTLSANLNYEKGEVNGTIRYDGKNANATVMINKDQIQYAASFNTAIKSRVELTGGVQGSTNFENPGIDATGNLGIKVNLGKGGELTGGAFLRKGKEENEGRPDWGGSVDYTASF